MGGGAVNRFYRPNLPAKKCAELPSILGEVLIFFIIVTVMSLPSEWDKNSSCVISENRPTCRILQKKRKHKRFNGGDLVLLP